MRSALVETFAPIPDPRQMAVADEAIGTVVYKSSRPANSLPSVPSFLLSAA
jgi:hypothetical protein